MNYQLLKNIQISGLRISDHRKLQPDLVTVRYTERTDCFVVGTTVPREIKTDPLERATEAIVAIRYRGAIGRFAVTIGEP